MIGTSVIKEFNEELKHFRMAFSEINDYPNNLVCKVVKLEIQNIRGSEYPWYKNSKNANNVTIMVGGKATN